MPYKYFTEEEKSLIKQAIEKAEKNTSGEIKVHIDLICKIDVMDRATLVFEKLKMHKTELRNGVLIYLAIESKQFAILGDVGINMKVPTNFWDDVRDNMLAFFKEGKFAEGLEKGILLSGEQLAKYFPYNNNDINELSDEISFGSK